MSGYVSNVPLSSQSLGQTQGTINNNFTVINTNMGVDHVDFTNSPPASGGVGGEHLQVSFSAPLSGPPSTVTGNIGALYTKLVSSQPQVFYTNSTGTVQITGNEGTGEVVANTPGSVTLFGGIIMKWGPIPLAVSGVISFNTGGVANFPNACWVVTTGQNDSSLTRGSLLVSGVSPTGFSYSNNGSNTVAGYYIAVGN